MVQRIQILALLTFLPVAASPLTLEAALREALTNSNQVRISDEKLVRSREFENEQRGVLYPQVSLYANAGRGGQAVSNEMVKMLTRDTLDRIDDYTNYTGNMFSYGLQVNGPIYTFGKLSTAIDMAKMQDESVRFSVKKEKQDLQIQVVDAYTSVVLASTRVGVLERSRARAEETWKSLDRDFQAGKGLKSDVLIAKANLKSLEPQILTARRDADMARRNFNRLLGRSPEDNADLDTLGQFAALESDALPSRVECIRNAEENRADLRSVTVASKVYAGTAKIFDANYMPTIGYQGKFGLSGSEAEHLVEWVHREWQIGVGLTWTLFDGWGDDGANKAQAAQWRSDSRVFAYQAEELRRVIDIEIDGALADHKAADTTLQAALEGREAATEAVTLLKSMSGGMIRLTDILAAEDGLRNAELGVLSARFSRTRALAKLRLVQGLDLIAISEAK